MPSFNRVILCGNVTRDPELRHTANGKSVAEFGLAVNDSYKSADGQLRDECLFIDLNCWGKTAEIASQFVTKGAPILIEGRLKADEWTDKQSGQKRSKIRVTVDRLQMLGNKGAPAKETYREPEPVAAAADTTFDTPDSEIPF